VVVDDEEDGVVAVEPVEAAGAFGPSLHFLKP